MELHLRHHPSCRLPTGCLIEKALVPHDGFVTGPPHRARQQFLDVAHHAVVRRNPNRTHDPRSSPSRSTETSDLATAARRRSHLRIPPADCRWTVATDRGV